MLLITSSQKCLGHIPSFSKLHSSRKPALPIYQAHMSTSLRCGFLEPNALQTVGTILKTEPFYPFYLFGQSGSEYQFIGGGGRKVRGFVGNFCRCPLNIFFFFGKFPLKSK